MFAINAIVNAIVVSAAKAAGNMGVVGAAGQLPLRGRLHQRPHRSCRYRMSWPTSSRTRKTGTTTSFLTRSDRFDRCEGLGETSTAGC